MASTFKARCLALLDQLAVDRVPLVITKRGRPIARVLPMDEPPAGGTTRGSVRLVAEDDEAYFTTGAPWESGE